MQTGAGNGDVSLSGDVRKGNDYGPMPTAGSFGDSGSPMFIYDATEKKWLINGVLRTGNPSLGRENTFQLVRKNYFDEIFSANLKTTIFDFRTPKNQQNQHYTFHSKMMGQALLHLELVKFIKSNLLITIYL